MAAKGSWMASAASRIACVVPHGLVRPAGTVKRGGMSSSDWKTYSTATRFSKRAPTVSRNCFFDVLADDEDELAEAGAKSVEDGVVDDGFAGGADGVDLLEAAVAAAHAGSENKKCGRGCGGHQSEPFQAVDSIEWYNTRALEQYQVRYRFELHGQRSAGRASARVGCHENSQPSPTGAISTLASCRAGDCECSRCCSAAQTPPTHRTQSAQNLPPAAPDWAQPGSATHQQVAPPADFHRPSTNFDTPIGIFDGQSDIGSALVPGSASFDAATGQYTINSAGYNVWYTRDEFRFLWKRMSGDVSLAADINFPDPKGYGDRKAVLMIRQSLDDDSKAAMVAEHGAGMVHLAWRPEKDVRVTDMEFRMGGRGRPGGASPDSLVTISAKRIGIEKHGDEFSIWMSLDGEPMHQFGPPIKLHLDAPFYVGIGFCSHQPETVDTAVLSNVVLENEAGKVQ